MTSVHIQRIPAFTDNYLWLIHNSQNAIVVDPGDAAPIQAYLNQHNLTLSAILVTHHHADHIGGITELLADAPKGIPVFGPATDLARITAITHGCQDSEKVDIPELGLEFSVLFVPGHTVSHIAYFCASLAALFSGDTLFAGGCGRIFEGTPVQMLTSLKKMAALPATTQIYCAHEYTLSNLRFAVAVEPNNTALKERFQAVSAARLLGVATVPSLLETEIATNPFLRSQSPEIIGTLQAHQRLDEATDEVSVFTATRHWKNSF